MILRAILVAGLGLLGACQASGPSHTVIPQAPSAPSLDGPAVGGAWANALVLTDITKQQTFEPPAKSIQARMLYEVEIRD